MVGMEASSDSFCLVSLSGLSKAHSNCKNKDPPDSSSACPFDF